MSFFKYLFMEVVFELKASNSKPVTHCFVLDKQGNSHPSNVLHLKNITFWNMHHFASKYLICKITHPNDPRKNFKKKLEMQGIDPRTSRMLSERSTIWATSPNCWQLTGHFILCNYILLKSQNHPAWMHNTATGIHSYLTMEKLTM